MLQSYKIFVRDTPLIISESTPELRELLTVISPDILDEPQKFLEDASLWDNEKAGFLLESAIPKDDFQKLCNALKLIRAAGGVVWNDKNELLMIFRRGFWDLPKGKIDKGESTENAALREVEEETGLGDIELKELIDISYHIYFEKKWILKETYWYNMTCINPVDLVPQAEEDIEIAIWVTKKEIAGYIPKTYSSIAGILSKID